MPKIEQDIYLVAALRTPIGNFGGALSALTAAQLAQARSTRVIHRVRRDLVTKSALDRDLPRNVRADACLTRIAEDHLVDSDRVDTRSRKSGLRAFGPGLATLCISGGMGLSMIVERV